MTTVPMINFYNIDTLQFSKRMQKAGLKTEVADELAEALREAQSQSTEGFATKADIELIRKESKIEDGISTKQDLQILENVLRKDTEILGNDLRKDMVNLENALRKDMKILGDDLRKDMSFLKQDIIIKLGSLMAVGIGIIAILIKF
jgi:DNA polymerase/3'-5' exonuclease PolX